MSKKPVLVVLAAGMGSRYGGLKQIDPIGPQGEAILDYSIYDAHRAGFEKVVLLIKEAIKKDFMETVGARLKNAPVEIVYAYQELDKLPEGYAVPEGRVKPWGTSHAVMCAAEAIDGAPFAVINADDFYGRSAFETVYQGLLSAESETDHCMVGYELGKTVTEHGSVARGVCETDEKGYLTGINERTRIEQYEGGIHYTEDGETWVDVDPQAVVSMNFWGFQPSFLKELNDRFGAFLDANLEKNPLKCEYFLPLPVAQVINEGVGSIKVLSSADRWFGVTYAADKPMVVAAIQKMTEEGKYPNGLWK